MICPMHVERGAYIVWVDGDILKWVQRQGWKGNGLPPQLISCHLSEWSLHELLHTGMHIFQRGAYTVWVDGNILK